MDDKSAGDDHIRLVKAVIRDMFPNVAGPVFRIAAPVREFHPVVRLRMESGNAPQSIFAKTPRKLHSVGAGSGVSLRAPAAVHASRHSRQSERRI